MYPHNTCTEKEKRGTTTALHNFYLAAEFVPFLLPVVAEPPPIPPPNHVKWQEPRGAL